MRKLIQHIVLLSLPFLWNGSGGPGYWDAGGTTLYSDNISYTATTANTRSSLIEVPFEVSCSGNLLAKDSRHPLSLQEPLEKDSCQRWYAWIGPSPQTQEEYKMQYDTLTRYIESCAYKETNCSHAFTGLRACINGYMPDDTTRFDRFREWLLDVIHINSPDPYYTCSCLLAIASVAGDEVPNAALAIYRYVLDHTPCSSKGLEFKYQELLASRHERWLQGDTTIPEDTVLPSLAELGLGFLLGVDDDGNGTVPATEYITSLGISPNPFRSETTIRYHLSQSAYVLPLVYDQLGRVVFGDGNGRVFTEGDHEFTLDGTNLSSGVYYVRLQANSQKRQHVRTIKIVKE